MSTNRGLARFDPRDESFTLYDTTHGLQGMEFNFGAYFKNAQGEMFFGGTDGFSQFDPESIGQNRHRPPVRLTSFKKLNVEADFAAADLGHAVKSPLAGATMPCRSSLRP